MQRCRRADACRQKNEGDAEKSVHTLLNLDSHTDSNDVDTTTLPLPPNSVSMKDRISLCIRSALGNQIFHSSTFFERSLDV